MIPELKQNLVSYIGRYTHLKKVAAHEFAGPCPRCGGTDRLRVNDEKGFFCRKCNGEKWGDLADFTALAFGWSLKETLRQFNLDRRATPEEITRLEAERRAHEQEARRKEQAEQERVHKFLTESGIAQQFNRNINEYPEGREEWHKRGLSDEWIGYYGLGYSPSHVFTHNEQTFTSPSITIPYYRPVYTPSADGGDDMSWKIVQLKHRLLLDDTPGGKYRPHTAGAGNHPFFTDLCQRNVYGDLLIVEGEIKAMVTWSAMWDKYDLIFPNVTVIGIPGQSWKDEWLEQFTRAERVFIILDPDAQVSAARLAARLGDKAKNIRLPDKIDDLITAGILDGFKIMELCNG